MRATEDEIGQGLRWALIGFALLVMGTALGVIVSWTDATALDRWWNGAVASIAPGLLPLAHAMDVLGGGWVGTLLVPSVIALALVAARMPWSAAMFVAASVVSALYVQLLKGLFGRARPEEILVVSDFGSFPSGHTANAATIVVVAVVLFPKAWVALAGVVWTASMGFSRTQVHAHWLADTVGGALVGAGAALVVAAVFAVPVLRHR